MERMPFFLLHLKMNNSDMHTTRQHSLFPYSTADFNISHLLFKAAAL